MQRLQHSHCAIFSCSSAVHRHLPIGSPQKRRHGCMMHRCIRKCARIYSMQNAGTRSHRTRQDVDTLTDHRPRQAASVAPQGCQDRRHLGLRRFLHRTCLIMNGPGRLWHSRHDLDHAGSSAKRTRDPKPVVGVPVVGGVPVAVGGAEVPWIVVPGTAAEHPATRSRSGFRGSGGRIEPAAP